MSKSVLTIRSLFHEYTAEFDRNLTEEIQDLSKEHKLHFLVDSRVLELYAKKMAWLERASSVIKIDAIEQNKDITEVQNIALTLLNKHINKNDALIVIGGGILQDLGAFTANIVKRGIKWYFIPTTLLAMCDSCIGSKCGINMAGFKNQLGVFCPPARIFVDAEFLTTLDPLDIVSGIGEIIKVHLISSAEDFDHLYQDMDKLASDFTVLQRYIHRSLEIKKAIAEEDEFDVDYRHILNYGHTFGHGIEAYGNNEIPHGIGVAIGMEIANYISVKMGFLAEEEFERISVLLRKFIPYDALDFSDFERMASSLKKDKKYDGEHLNIIVSRGAGRIFKEKVLVDHTLLGFIDACAKRHTRLKAS